MRVHVLLFDAGSDAEGIHSLEMSGTTVVLLFENPDDAERYAGLLEAQDFPVPTVEAIEREEIEEFCRQSGYDARFIESGASCPLWHAHRAFDRAGELQVQFVALDDSVALDAAGTPGQPPQTDAQAAAASSSGACSETATAQDNRQRC